MLDAKNGIMVDIETLSHRPNACILSIGAIAFDENINEIDSFYQIIDFGSCEKFGLDISTSTLEWWLKKDSIVRNEAFSGKTPLGTALIEFCSFVLRYRDFDVWAKSPSFDLVILRHAIKKCGIGIPWNYKQERDVRTLVEMFPLDVKAEDVEHRAIDDARAQTRHLKKIVELFK